jgi:flagellar protein FlaF
MAVGEIIGAAIGILMLIIVAYLVVGTTLSTAELVVAAQKDITQQNEIRLNTGMAIISYYQPDAARYTFNFSLNNTGSETISDFTHFDLYTEDALSSGFVRYRYDRSGNAAGTWTTERIDRDFVHPQMLDPGESMWVCATYSVNTPVWVLVSTGTGATAAGSLT